MAKVEVTLWPTVSWPVSLGVRRSSGTRDQFYFLLEIFFSVIYCTIAVTLRSKFCRTHGHILLSHLRLPQPGGPGSRIYILQKQGGPVIPLGTGVGVGVLLAADSQSTSASGYRASLWDPWPDFTLLFLLRLTITFFLLSKAPSLKTKRVCSLQCDHSLVRLLTPNNHTLPSHLRLCSLFVASYDSQGLQWKYSNPPPHGVIWPSQSQSYIPTDSQSVSMPWCLAQSGTIDQSLLSPWKFF
jgi:hypothetical protein